MEHNPKYVVRVWSHSCWTGAGNVKYMEADDETVALLIAQEEAEYLECIARDFDIDIYRKEDEKG